MAFILLLQTHFLSKILIWDLFHCKWTVYKKEHKILILNKANKIRSSVILSNLGRTGGSRKKVGYSDGQYKGYFSSIYCFHK